MSSDLSGPPARRRDIIGWIIMRRDSAQGKSVTHRPDPLESIMDKLSVGLIQRVHPYVSDIAEMDGRDSKKRIYGRLWRRSILIAS
jgi:hypothetical protein